MQPGEQELRDAQWKLLAAIYDCERDSAEEAKLLAEYQSNIDCAIASGLDAVAHCNSVDPMGFESYSDCYKDVNGFRPRGFVTRAQARVFLEPFRMKS